MPEKPAMPAMRVLILRHHEEDLPGFVGEAFAERDATVDTYLYPEDGPLPDLQGYDHLVILGSSASVYDSKDWIAAELDWLRHVQVPVLGICFGAQLLAASFGGRVERSPVYEVGWARVDAIRGERPVIGPGPWFEFHGDRCVLPESARLIATNEVGVQAFTVGRHLGVQFHPEVDASQLQRWIDNGGGDAVVKAGKDPEALVEETAREGPSARLRTGEFIDTYLQYASG